MNQLTTRALPSAAAPRWMSALALLASAGLAGCGSGGGGGGGFDDGAQLLSVEFLDPLNVNPEDETVPPAAAPLVQQIRFQFSGSPSPDRVNADVIQVRNEAGFPVPGRYDVDGSTVVYTPDLPTRPSENLGGSKVDNGGAALEAGVTYSVRLGSRTWDFITDIDSGLQSAFGDPGDENGVLIQFTTTTKVSDFFKGLARRTPRLVSVSPQDGSSDVTPQLYSDPDGLFSERSAFFLTFDAPVLPEDENLGRFRLIDLDDRDTFADGLPLGVDVRVLTNEIDRSVIEVMPSGILPFGNMLSLEYPTFLRHLSAVEPDPGDEATIASAFTVATAPNDVRDTLLEGFDDLARSDLTVLDDEEGALLAEWNTQDSGVLQASFAFDGSGILGRFIPDPPPADDEDKLIILDTSRQVFPLFDGSTPDAPAGFEVSGGEFSFTEIDIPDRVVVEGRGPNPLILTATGSVRIAGTIRLVGQNGTDENAFDSAVTSIPGGPAGSGGGRGGVGHPIVYFPPDDISNLTLVSPLVGGRGMGPLDQGEVGGFGGQYGLRDKKEGGLGYGTDSEIVCTELSNPHNNGYQPPGGGGGSFAKRGKRPQKDGVGNVLPDGRGRYILRTPESHEDYLVLLGGDPGQDVFADGDDDNDFFGLRGEFQQIHGGQGGGSGGGAVDGYFCGVWCKYDNDPNNDELCQGEFGNPPTFADSVGDARGGSGGGGGGAFQVKALGSILVTGTIDCRGGDGGGGEALGCGNWAGGGGGGAGGFIGLMSGLTIDIANGASLNVDAGKGAGATDSINYLVNCTRSRSSVGGGGNGGNGIIQLQVPAGTKANVDGGADLTNGAWSDKNNNNNPAEFSPESVARSTWYDMGRVIDRGNSSPIFQFAGLDPDDGFVETDADGNVLDPSFIEVDYLGQLDPLNPGQYVDGEEPRDDFIPPTSRVYVEFQGAEAVVEGSKEVDPATFTAWSSDVSVADGMQFVRYQIRFDIAFGGASLGPDSPRPAVQTVRIGAEF